ncbi:hypothetical protein BC835DRAFT_160717 [Cytidiella melzeri]|nr:hypothetical protein BC835DRAFT_160717 [Cytidiella melzeri]
MDTHYHQMPYDDFMNLFAKVGGPDQPNLSVTQLDAICKNYEPDRWIGKESLTRSSICTSLNEVVAEAARVNPESTRFVFRDVSAWPEKAEDDMNIDVAMYSDASEARRAYNSDIPSEILQENPHVARAAWAWMKVGLKVEGRDQESAFRSTESGPFLRDTGDGREAQAQLAEHASQLMVRQHRVFAFIIYISNGKARLTRWDRAGCIVSTPIDLKKNPEQLLNFVYRLALMPRAELGEDPTVELATEEEVQKLRDDYELKNPYAIARAKDILDNEVLYPIYKVACTSVDVKEKQMHFFGKHHVASSSSSPSGRATKGYVTFNQQNHRLSFMKDYWRSHTKRTRAELAVYQWLKEKQVSNVATALGGGDVDDQCTVTQEYLKDAGGIVKRSHYRIFFEELARPLDTYDNSAELIMLVWDALIAHEEAWTKAEILHCDISTNNIMRLVDQDDEKDAEPKGILNDWDLCKYKSDLNEQGVQQGTWAFMSATSLKYPFKPNELADDLEGFIHVITYCGLQFHCHNMTMEAPGPLSDADLCKFNKQNSRLRRYVAAHYDESWHCGKGIYAGGRQKMLCAKMGSPDFTFNNQQVSAFLIKLVNELYQLLKTHYSAMNFEEMGRFSGSKRSSGTVAPLAPVQTASSALRFSKYRKLPSLKPGQVPRETNTRTTAVSTPVAPRLTLSTHKEIKEAFADAVRNILDLDEERISFQCDKTQDQFFGLGGLMTAHRKGPSGSGKRKSDSLHDGNTKKARVSSHLAKSLGQVKEVDEQ